MYAPVKASTVKSVAFVSSDLVPLPLPDGTSLTEVFNDWCEQAAENILLDVQYSFDGANYTAFVLYQT